MADRHAGAPRTPLAPRLDNLPLFASDLEIAEAIVGRKHAAEWVKTRLPTLAGKPGFPPVDDFHGGRPVALVKRFYEAYLGIGERTASAASRVEDPSVWNRSRHRASNGESSPADFRRSGSRTRPT